MNPTPEKGAGTPFDKTSVYCFKVRVGVVVIDPQNRLLLVRQNQRPFWILPGGTLEVGESMAQCAMREIQEEANITVTNPRLLFMADFMVAPGAKQAVDVVFKVDWVGGDFQMETTENIDEMGFKTLEEVRAMNVRHEVIFEKLLHYWATDQWPEGAEYLGVFLPK